MGLNLQRGNDWVGAWTASKHSQAAAAGDKGSGGGGGGGVASFQGGFQQGLQGWLSEAHLKLTSVALEAEQMIEKHVDVDAITKATEVKGGG